VKETRERDERKRREKETKRRDERKGREKERGERGERGHLQAHSHTSVPRYSARTTPLHILPSNTLNAILVLVYRPPPPSSSARPSESTFRSSIVSHIVVVLL
jgi:hypothetical protein